MIEVYPETEEILPKRSGRARVTWKDIKQERENYNVQFSASSSLSKDPMTKMQQIEKMIAMRILDQSLAATFMDMPDLEGAYDINQASYDDCERIVERAAEDGKFDFFEVVNLQQLMAVAVNNLLRLDAHDEKREVLENILKLIQAVQQKMNDVKAAAAPPAMGPGQQPPATGPGAMPAPTAPGPTGPLPAMPGPQNPAA